MSAATAKPKKKHVGLTVFIVILVLLLRDNRPLL